MVTEQGEDNDLVSGYIIIEENSEEFSSIVDLKATEQKTTKKKNFIKEKINGFNFEISSSIHYLKDLEKHSRHNESHHRQIINTIQQDNSRSKFIIPMEARNGHSRLMKGKEAVYFDEIKNSVNELKLNKYGVMHFDEFHKAIGSGDKRNKSKILNGSFLDEKYILKKNKKVYNVSKKIGDNEFVKWEQQKVMAEAKLGLKYYDNDERVEYYPKLFSSEINKQLNFEIFPSDDQDEGHQGFSMDKNGYENFGDFSSNSEIFYSSKYSIKPFTAAIIALYNYDSMHNTDLIKSIVLPHKKESKFFNVKIFKNGVFRRVKVKPTLPMIINIPALTYTRKGTSKNKFYLWPSLIEKSLMKLYNIKKKERLDTSPCIEVYHLSGWLPEVIPLANINNFQELWIKIVMNLIDGNAIFFFQKHTSSDFFVLTGLGEDTSGLCQGVLKGVDVSEMDAKIPEQAKQISYNFDRQNMHNLFSSIHLCWSPFIFPKRKYFSGAWYEGNKRSLLWNEKYCMYHNPQFLIKIEGGDKDLEVRVLIERHVKDLSYRASSKIGQAQNVNKAEEGSVVPRAPHKVADRVGYKLFHYEGDRVFYGHDFVKGVKKSEREVLSDAFVFEASDETRLYCLCLLKANKRKGYVEKGQEIFFTLGVKSQISNHFYTSYSGLKM